MLRGYFISLLTNLFTEPDYNTLTLPGNAICFNLRFNLLVSWTIYCWNSNACSQVVGLYVCLDLGGVQISPPEEGWRVSWLKRCECWSEYNNHNSSSRIFWQSYKWWLNCGSDWQHGAEQKWRVASLINKLSWIYW